MRVLSAEPHHIGSPAGRKNAEWMRDQMKSWGLDAALEEFDVLFPTPRERVLEMIAPEKFQAKLKEPAIAEDSDSGDPNQLPTYNAYSGDGDVTAPLVYVNFGIPSDYEQLDKMGVNVRGKIVIARYGASWRGALPITYHVGGGDEVKVHLKVVSDWRLHTLYNVIGRIPGSAYPDEWIIRGNHHDAWVNGADDPVSGMAVVLEEARSFGELLKQGWRPKRTFIFCAWDGEEPGLLGSTEWAEQHAAELKQKAVVYINTDSTGKGFFSAGGSHTLERFVNDVARSVRDPKEKGSLWDVLQSRRAAGAQTAEQKRELSERSDLRISALGSGSDYTAFLDHLGVASLNVGFGGEGGGGIYHSIYDSFAWYTRFSDTTFAYSRTLAQAAGTMAMRLADAKLLPFEFTNFAETVAGYVEDIAQLPKQGVDLAPLRKSVEGLRRAADDYDRALRALAQSGALPADLKAMNALLYQSERALLSEAGLPRRDWFKHQVYAPGFYTGYGVKTLPGVREAIEQKNWSEASEQVKVVSKALDAMVAQIAGATRKLSGQ